MTTPDLPARGTSQSLHQEEAVEEELDVSPFFDYLKSEHGHEVAQRALGIIDDVKKAALEHGATDRRLEKYLQIAIVVCVVTAASVLAYFGKLDSTIGVLFGTLVGYVFGKKT